MELFSPSTADISRVQERYGGRGGGRRGGGKSRPIRKVQTMLVHFHFIFLISNTFETVGA